MKIGSIVLLLCLVIVAVFILPKLSRHSTPMLHKTAPTTSTADLVAEQNPLSIPYIRSQTFPGSDITIEETLDSGINYNRYIVSYKSQGYKIYGLLTIPQGDIPKTGWPVIIFNHGYIEPSIYRTTERYVAYQDGFARSGYITFKSDYRGHGSSEGSAEGAYGNNGYAFDVLNAVASVKRLKDPAGGAATGTLVDSHRIGMWGHSMGGFLTLRAMVVDKEIKAGVIWSGVVAPYEDLLFNWRRTDQDAQARTESVSKWRKILTDRFGTPDSNPDFWHTLSANYYLRDISGPLQIVAVTGDDTVPVEFSRKLVQEMNAVKKPNEYIEYKGDDHNVTENFNDAMERAIRFFDTYVKYGK